MRKLFVCTAVLFMLGAPHARADDIDNMMLQSQLDGIQDDLDILADAQLDRELNACLANHTCHRVAPPVRHYWWTLGIRHDCETDKPVLWFQTSQCPQ